MSADIQILIFARFPIPGRTKTRLIPALGSEVAAQLHRRMTEHVLSVARNVRDANRTDNIGISICYTGGHHKDFRAWLGPGLQYISQASGDLGARMRCTFKSAFLGGAKFMLAVGSDIPGLSPEILRQAMDGLHKHDVVIGPAKDGGYYLIGTKHFYPELFTAIDWGSGRVSEQTRRAIKRLGLSAMELVQQSDVDRTEDLALLRNDPRFVDVFTRKPLLSVVIPTLNEGQTLERSLERVCSGDAVEVIVTDGGSKDSTCEIAKNRDALVLRIPGGRAHQLNAGAAAANGRLLLFLHADTLLPKQYDSMIRRTLENPATVAGAFKFQTDNSSAAMSLIEWAANIRSRVFQLPYGDQGLFMERRVFEKAGGFSRLPIMEDFDLVRRLRRRGKIVTLRHAAITSARRWVRLGIIRTTIINQVMIAGFLGRVPIGVLERFYRSNLDKCR